MATAFQSGAFQLDAFQIDAGARTLSLGATEGADQFSASIEAQVAAPAAGGGSITLVVPRPPLPRLRPRVGLRLAAREAADRFDGAVAVSWIDDDADAELLLLAA